MTKYIVVGRPDDSPTPCSFCKKAVELLTTNSIDFEYIPIQDLEDMYNKFPKLAEKAVKSVPQIFDNLGEYIEGGYNGLRNHLFPPVPEDLDDIFASI